MTPSDCLSIGCFLEHTKIGLVKPVLIRCNINDAAFRMLVHQVIIKEQLHCNRNRPIHVCLDYNPITHKGLEFLKEGLDNRVLTFSVDGCLRSSLHPNTHVNIFKALRYLIEGLSRTTSAFFFSIGYNEITAEHKFYLLLLILFTKSLMSLRLSGNNLRGSMTLLAPALNYSKLMDFTLFNCCLDDNDIVCLARALHRNFTLTSLVIARNSISPHAFSELLLAIQYSAISDLIYDGQITVAHRVMLNAISNNRHTAHMQPLDLQDTYTLGPLGKQCAKRMLSLPPEFATGQERIHHHLSESKQETDTHPCLTQ